MEHDRHLLVEPFAGVDDVVGQFSTVRHRNDIERVDAPDRVLLQSAGADMAAEDRAGALARALDRERSIASANAEG
jgi:hypothetical protein